MDWLKSNKVTAIVGAGLAVVALQGYGFVSMRSALENRMDSLEHAMQSSLCDPTRPGESRTRSNTSFVARGALAAALGFLASGRLSL